jgi:hypothetical protein
MDRERRRSSSRLQDEKSREYEKERTRKLPGVVVELLHTKGEETSEDHTDLLGSWIAIFLEQIFQYCRLGQTFPFEVDRSHYFDADFWVRCPIRVSIHLIPVRRDLKMCNLVADFHNAGNTKEKIQTCKIWLDQTDNLFETLDLDNTRCVEGKKESDYQNQRWDSGEYSLIAPFLDSLGEALGNTEEI